MALNSNSKQLAIRANCIFHDDKIGFYEVCQVIYKERIIPKKCMDRCAMAVCSCRRKDDVTSRSSVFDVEMTMLRDKVLHHLSHRCASEKNLRILTDYIVISVMKEEYIQSGSKFLKILHDVLCGNPNALDVLSNKKGNTPTPLKKTNKFGHYNFQFMMRKKKKKALIKSKIILPLFGGNSKYLEQDESVGKGFNVIARQLKCQLFINGKATKTYMDASATKLVIDLWCNDMKCVDLVTKILENVATKIQSRHPKKIVCRWSAKYMYQTNEYNVQPYNGHSRKNYVDFDYKEDSTAVYSKKNLMKNKHGRRNPKVNVLENGHCFHCQKKFDYLHQANMDGDCQFHSGYLVTVKGEHVWSCCGNKCISEQPTAEAHHLNGCTFERHLWRTHKKSSRNKPNASVSLPDCEINVKQRFL